MPMQRPITGLILTLVLIPGALATHAAAATAQDPGTLVIAKANCPTAMPGDDVDFATCTEAAAGVEFFIATPNTGNVEFGTTGGDGQISFPLEPYVLGPDSVVSVGEILAGNPVGEVTGYFVNCLKNDEALAIEYEQVEVQPGGLTYGIQFNVESGDQVACDWFNVPAMGDVTPPPTAPPADDGSITVYKTACPPGYTGADYFADCYDNPQPGVAFSIGAFGTDQDIRGETGGGDLAGLVTFALPPNVTESPDGRLAIAEVAPYPEREPVVTCTKNDGSEVLTVEEINAQVYPFGPVFAVAISVGAGDQVHCDWYNLPVTADVAPTPTEDLGTTPLPTITPLPTATPDPGRPAAVYEGECMENEDALGGVTAELADLSAPEGETVGQEDAVVAETSVTTVPLSLDELLDEDHAIGVGRFEEGEDVSDAEDAEAVEDLAVCGEIGGVVNENGNLVIGLSAVEDSRFNGIAFLSPNGDDPDQTDISVFLAEEPTSDREETPESTA